MIIFFKISISYYTKEITQDGNEITTPPGFFVDEITGNEITVSKLIELGYLTPTKGERIAKPDDKNKCLDDNYGVRVEWNNKSFTFTSDELIWESCN